MISTIIRQLAGTSKRSEKEHLLQSNRDNELLKQYFVLALDPMITFGVKKIPSYATNDVPSINLSTALGELSKLTSRALTGNAAITFLQNMLASLPAEDAALVCNIIEKNARCGVAESTVNKTWPNAVFDYPVMKAEPYDDKTIQKIIWPAYSQTKLDGARCSIVIRNQQVTCLSSSGREIEVHATFDYLARLATSCVLDGELLVIDPDTGTIMERKRGNGIVNKAIKGTISAREASSLLFVLFDRIELSDWVSGYSAVEYKTRLNSCIVLLDDIKHDYPSTTNIRLVDTQLVLSEQQAVSHFKTMLANDEEGTILKNLASPWEGKRSPDNIKMKGLLTCDLRVVGVEPGTGKHTGKVGALICESSDGEVCVSVGSGLSDDDRSKPDWVGKVVEVAYNERIAAAGSSKWSLFLPRILRARLDKNTADNINNIPSKMVG